MSESDGGRARPGAAGGPAHRRDRRRHRPSADPDAPIGNGRAISVLAGREGAAVACVDRDPARPPTPRWP